VKNYHFFQKSQNHLYSLQTVWKYILNTFLMYFNVIWPIGGRFLSIFGKIIVFSHITGFGTEILHTLNCYQIIVGGGNIDVFLYLLKKNSL